MPPYPFSPYEDITFEGNKMYESTIEKTLAWHRQYWTDVFARLCYAFNISISFALLLTIVNYIVGILIGGAMGYYGGKFDLIFNALLKFGRVYPCYL